MFFSKLVRHLRVEPYDLFPLGRMQSCSEMLGCSNTFSNVIEEDEELRKGVTGCSLAPRWDEKVEVIELSEVLFDPTNFKVNVGAIV